MKNQFLLNFHLIKLLQPHIPNILYDHMINILYFLVYLYILHILFHHMILHQDHDLNLLLFLIRNLHCFNFFLNNSFYQLNLLISNFYFLNFFLKFINDFKLINLILFFHLFQINFYFYRIISLFLPHLIKILYNVIQIIYSFYFMRCLLSLTNSFQYLDLLYYFKLYFLIEIILFFLLLLFLILKRFQPNFFIFLLYFYF